MAVSSVEIYHIICILLWNVSFLAIVRDMLKDVILYQTAESGAKKCYMNFRLWGLTPKLEVKILQAMGDL